MEKVNPQDVTPYMLLKFGFIVNYVVRNHPKPNPIIKRKNDGSYVVTYEVTQEQMNNVILKL